MPNFNFDRIDCTVEDYYHTSYRYYGGYYRSNRDAIIDYNHIYLKEALNIQPNESILIIGAGFGWIAEEWTKMGLGPICCTDTSPWIQANTQTETAPNITIHNLDINVAADRDAIKAILNLGPNDKFKWGITEDVLPCLTDQQALEMSNNLQLISETVVHYVTINSLLGTAEWVPTQLPHNWKTAQHWKSILGSVLIARAGTHEVT